MSVYVLRAESLALETCILSLVTGYATLLALVTLFHAAHITGLLLLAATCAFGICATGVEHRKFSRGAAALSALSCVAAFAHTGVVCERFRNMQVTDISENVESVLPQAIPITIGFVVVLLLKIMEIGLAGVLVVKHARISMQQGPRSCTTMVPTMEMQDNRSTHYPQGAINYGNLPAMQPAAGQPAYL